MIVGFTGYAQSGKDTAAQFLVERGFIRLAFADALRESLYALNPIVYTKQEYIDDQCHGGWEAVPFRVQEIVERVGWDVAKVEYPEIRQLLQRFGTEVGREIYGENFWVERVTDQINPHYGDYVITDVRFPNEEKAVHDLGGKVYKISRLGVQAANNHASENIDVLQVDGVIPNHDGIDLFRDRVLEMVGLK